MTCHKNKVNEVIWCIVGDFNTVRLLEEMMDSQNIAIGGHYMEVFNNFIHEWEVEDIPMIGRRYTWYISSSRSKSKLFRFLVSYDWLEKC